MLIYFLFFLSNRAASTLKVEVVLYPMIYTCAFSIIVTHRACYANEKATKASTIITSKSLQACCMGSQYYMPAPWVLLVPHWSALQNTDRRQMESQCIHGSSELPSRILNLYRTKWALGHWRLFLLQFPRFYTFLFLVTCARLSWPHSAFQFTLKSSIVYRIVSYEWR